MVTVCLAFSLTPQLVRYRHCSIQTFISTGASKLALFFLLVNVQSKNKIQFALPITLNVIFFISVSIYIPSDYILHSMNTSTRLSFICLYPPPPPPPHSLPRHHRVIIRSLKNVLLLFFNNAMQPLRLIVRSGLDVSTFATRRLHACNHARAPSGGRWNCGREISGNFA